MGAEVNVGTGRGVGVGAGADAVCGWEVGGAGMSVAAAPHATTATITVANATSRNEAVNRDIPAV